MPQSPPQTLESITLETATSPDAAIIWLHGLGADGNDFVPVVEQLRLPPQLAIRFIFPHAPVRPISLNQGYPMRGWYDLYGLSLNDREDEAGIRQAGDSIYQLCRQQQTAGIKSSRIILAGFSQGGALALYSGLRYPEKLAGILALSTYLCLKTSLVDETSPDKISPFATEIPVFMAHGRQDDVLLYEYGHKSAEIMKTAGINIDWHSYDMGHNVSTEETMDIRQWIIQQLS